jgi:hypothetical protein
MSARRHPETARRLMPAIRIVNQTRTGKKDALACGFAAAADLASAEVPSYEHARIHGESNLSTFRDGRRVLRTILTEWHNR